MPIFSSYDRRKADFILKCPYCRLSDLASFEARELAVVWSYYSGRIDGNSYTYAETETLLKDGITSKRRFSHAVTLKNMHRAFTALLESPHTPIDARIMAMIRSTIADRGDVDVIIKSFYAILPKQVFYSDPLERAVFLHCNIAGLQPFSEVGKLMALLAESLVLMNADTIPVYSVAETDIQAYRNAMTVFYETGDYSAYKNYFLNVQLERISRILPANEHTLRTELASLLEGKL